MTETLARPDQTASAPRPLVPRLAAGRGAESVDGVLRCRARVPVTHDVMTFVLEPPSPRHFVFSAGQYLRVRVSVDGRQLERCYTISSPPTRPHLLTITVKRHPGGPVSTWLHERLQVGEELEVAGPYGRFTLGDLASAEAHGSYLFLSAGSGATPLLSMTRALRDAWDPADVVFVHSARTPDDLLCRRELTAMAAAGPGLRVHFVCEGDGVGEAWGGLRGRLSSSTLLALAPDLLQREVYTCGPEAYMASVRDMLTTARVDPARCHEESFDLAPSPRGDPEPAHTDEGPATKSFSVELARTGRTIECAAGTTVLQAAAQAGVALASSCGEGVCGTCATSLVTGQVDMRHGGGLRPRDEARGRFLPCCSTPLSDLVVDV